jgi:hypothetical protein
MNLREINQSIENQEKVVSCSRHALRRFLLGSGHEMLAVPFTWLLATAGMSVVCLTNATGQCIQYANKPKINVLQRYHILEQ